MKSVGFDSKKYTELQTKAILDRMEGGAKAFTDRGYSFQSLFTIADFGIEPPQA